MTKSTTPHSFAVTGSILHINLCPIGTLCLVSTELVGPVTIEVLVLTYSTEGPCELDFSVQRSPHELRHTVLAPSCDSMVSVLSCFHDPHVLRSGRRGHFQRPRQ